MKSQTVRLLDVFLIGPVIAYAGLRESDLPSWLKVSLIVFGGSTIVYNGMNYLEIKKTESLGL